MRKIFFIMTLICLTTMGLFAQGNEKSQVGIMRFSGENMSESDANVVRNLFRISLLQTGEYRVIARDKIDAIAKELETQMSGMTESERAAEIGSQLNLEYMIFGSLMKLGDMYYIVAYMVNVQSGEVSNPAKSPKFGNLNNADIAIENVVSMLAKRETKITKDPVNVTDPVEKEDPVIKYNGDKKIKVALITSGIAVGGAGVVLNILGRMDKAEIDMAYDDYMNATSDFTTHWNNYQETYDIFSGAAKGKTIGAFACYGTAAALISAGIFKKTGKRVAVTPYITGETKSLSVKLKF